MFALYKKNVCIYIIKQKYKYYFSKKKCLHFI